jgi:hypothetical protein
MIKLEKAAGKGERIASLPFPMLFIILLRRIREGSQLQNILDRR